MSILREVLIFSSERDKYTAEEQEKIEKSLRNKIKGILKNTSSSLIDAIEEINNA